MAIYRTIILLLGIFAGGAIAQTNVDITGRWMGSVEIPLAQDIHAEYTFLQNGLLISGYAKLKSLNGRDSMKYKLSGSVKNGVIHFKGTEFEYKTGSACLSKTELKYSHKNNPPTLTGRWKGDLKLSTCPPGVSGKVELGKIIDAMSDPIASHEVVKIKPNDFEGTELVKELSKRKYYALIIGIDDYADDGIQNLDNPVKDALEIKRVLQTNYTFEPENIQILTNPTRTNIIESFDLLSEKITERDHFLVFYAGHGIWDERLSQGFWLPADAKLSSKAQWLSNSTIRDYITGIKSKHTLLITDACFSGSIFKERAVTFDNSRAMLEMYKLPSRKAMTSGALKTVPDKSVFITYLTKNLINNTHPLLSAEELFRTFKIAVINNSTNGQVPQYGPIGQAGDEGGDFIFLRRAD